MSSALKYLGTAAAVASACMALTACGGDKEATWTAESPELAGLPNAVVAERLADPVFQQTLKETATDERLSMIQLQVASTVFCRDLYAKYQSWLNTGEAPTATTFAEPDDPAQGFADFAGEWESMFQQAIDSGDPEELRTELIAPLGCDSVIIDPASADHATIADKLGES